jgi:nucleoside-diphosphate-sugar epimerase
MNGHQTRSFMYIDDCIKGIGLILESGIEEPINLGSSELVSVNQLVDKHLKDMAEKLKASTPRRRKRQGTGRSKGTRTALRCRIAG